MDESTPWKKITRKELYEKFPYLDNFSMSDMIQLINLCFQMNSDKELIFYIKCYMHSYPELAKSGNLHTIYKLD